MWLAAGRFPWRSLYPLIGSGIQEPDHGIDARVGRSWLREGAGDALRSASPEEPPPVNCDQFKAYLHAYFEDALPSRRKAELDRHSADCRPCGDLMKLCREISCREFVEFLDDYLEGALPPERREVFERHLDICPDCKAYLDSYRKTMELSAAALQGGEPLVPLPVPEDLIRAILAARGRR